MPADISIIGEINLDLLLYGLPEQMPLERELLANDFRMTLGSSSAILAHNLAALGSRVAFTTCVGPDPLGKIALEYLRSAGIDLSRVFESRAGVSTGITLLLPHKEERHILTYPGTMFELHYSDLDLAYLRSARHFHLSSIYLQRGLFPDIPKLFSEMKTAGLTTSLDTNDDPDDRWEGLEEIFPHLDLFFPNAREGCRIAKTDSIEEAAEWLAARVPTVVLKLGRDGALMRTGKHIVRIGSERVSTVDSVGAGDSFDAGFLHQFMAGASPEQCLRSANRVAAYSTTAAGGVDAFRDRERMKQFLAGGPM